MKKYAFHPCNLKALEPLSEFRTQSLFLVSAQRHKDEKNRQRPTHAVFKLLPKEEETDGANIKPTITPTNRLVNFVAQRRFPFGRLSPDSAVKDGKFPFGKRKEKKRVLFCLIIGKMIQLQVHLQLPCYDFCFLY